MLSDGKLRPDAKPATFNRGSTHKSGLKVNFPSSDFVRFFVCYQEHIHGNFPLEIVSVAICFGLGESGTQIDWTNFQNCTSKK